MRISRYATLFFIASGAILAVIALVGASSASATVLCEKTPTGFPPACPEAETYPVGTNIEGTAVNARFTPNGLFPDVVCSHSEMRAETLTTGGAEKTVTAKVLYLAFSGCETPFQSKCSVEVTALPFHAEIKWSSGHNGSLTMSEGGGGGDPGMAIFCSGILDCEFDSPTFHLPITGGTTATLTANGLELNVVGGGLCPTEAQWDGSYNAVGFTPSIWVAVEEEE
jgi:hypothetical protein